MHTEKRDPNRDLKFTYGEIMYTREMKKLIKYSYTHRKQHTYAMLNHTFINIYLSWIQILTLRDSASKKKMLWNFTKSKKNYL